jgi:zinc transport system ATP-binding protein
MDVDEMRENGTGSTAPVLMECDSLSYRYEQSAAFAVRDVSFVVNEGDYICIVGENGSGKSTLIRMIAGLAKPTKGSVTLRRLDRNEVGYLPQQAPVRKDFPASVMEVVLSGRLNRKKFLPFFGRKDIMAAEASLDKLGVLGLKRKSYRELSGGQRQRILLARALCASEKLLVLDEPVTGLDPPSQVEMYRVIRELNDRGMAVLMVSHDVSEVINAANKILHMDVEALFFGDTDSYRRSAPGRNFLTTATKNGVVAAAAETGAAGTASKTAASQRGVAKGEPSDV